MRNLRHAPGFILARIVRFIVGAAVVVAFILLFTLLLIVKLSMLVLREILRTFPG
jgi:hypothetical protein